MSITHKSLGQRFGSTDLRQVGELVNNDGDASLGDLLP